MRISPDASQCRLLAERAKTAMLSTIARDPAGFPYGSLVAVAFDATGRPLFLLSRLAEHTKNLLASSEASVLVTEPAGDRDPLSLGRLTLLGTCASLPAGEIADARATFLAQQPAAATYVDFADFTFYRLEPRGLRWVGGFGRMSWVTVDDYRLAWQ